MYARQSGPRPVSKSARQRTLAAGGIAARSARPGSTPVAAVLTLQRLAGNAAVTRLLAERQRDTVRAALATTGRPLGTPVLADMEARLGADLSGVRVHTGPAADRAAGAVGGDAFTTGSHVVFRHGGYDPSSPAGRRVLAHELVHVLQQRKGPVTGTAGPLRISDPADRFEREADTTARRITRRQAAASPAGAGAHPPVTRQSVQPAGTSVQRHWTGKTHPHYGKLKNDCGTAMQAELHPGSVSMGTVPSVRPSWWSFPVAATKAFFSRFMVQGHLLNMKLGGPGNTMENLTPITKAANSAHQAAVEKYVKDDVLDNGKIVAYQMWAEYKAHPTGKDIVGTRLKGKAAKTVIDDIDTNYAPYMASQLFCQFAEVNKKGKVVSKSAGWKIQNASH